MSGPHAEAVSRLDRAVRAVTAEEPSLAGAAIPDGERQWHLAFAGWPAAPDVFLATDKPRLVPVSVSRWSAAAASR